jgi:aminocarboxymuconate-semialdehyde decarboxylase
MVPFPRWRFTSFRRWPLAGRKNAFARFHPVGNCFSVSRRAAPGGTERNRMIIDFHVHVLPPEDMPAFTGTGFHRNINAVRKGNVPTTIENALEAAKIGGVDITVISNPLHNLRDMDRQQQLERCQRQNRFNAAQQAKYPSIVGMASTVPYGGDEFLREFERAIKQDGLKGAWITSSLKGSYPDDDDAMPFFQLACELDVPVVIHPPSVGFGEERMRDYRLASSIGRPMDNALALARLIVRGIFERFPTLKLVGTHLGGGICEMIGRMDYAYRLQDEAYFLGSYEPMLIKHPPSHYLKMMYLESTCYHPPAARCAIDSVGAEHFIFGTDSPPLIPLKRQGLEMIDRIGLTPAQREKVMGGSAARLLKLGPFS